MTSLPKDYIQRMKRMLNTEFEAFIKTYDKTSSKGLRINTLKYDVEQFLKISPFNLEPISWCREGFYYREDERPGKHYYHAAGLYYIQEPSAMVVASILDPQHGERILDLSAAPGGKATQIAAKMNNTGLLVANEIHPTRVKALVENIERMGIKNTIVTNESASRLSSIFPEYFDRILVDAPCSGEGMFRKNPEAITEWSTEHVKYCAMRQQEILVEAQKMLKPSGILVYSTCTFAPEENEGTITCFLNDFPEFELEAIEINNNFVHGEASWVNADNTNSNIIKQLNKSVRLWPHKLNGEGHFVAKLKKTNSNYAKKINKLEYTASKEAIKFYNSFENENLLDKQYGLFHSFGNHLYLVPEGLPGLKGIKVARLGWHLGELKKNRFEPAHALAMGLNDKQAKQQYDLEYDNILIERFLKGETFNIEVNLKGWVLVTAGGFSLGWGKITDGQLKNHLPKGLRLL